MDSNTVETRLGVSSGRGSERRATKAVARRSCCLLGGREVGRDEVGVPGTSWARNLHARGATRVHWPNPRRLTIFSQASRYATTRDKLQQAFRSDQLLAALIGLLSLRARPICILLESLKCQV